MGSVLKDVCGTSWDREGGCVCVLGRQAWGCLRRGFISRAPEDLRRAEEHCPPRSLCLKGHCHSGEDREAEERLESASPGGGCHYGLMLARRCSRCSIPCLI